MATRLSSICGGLGVLACVVGAIGLLVPLADDMDYFTLTYLGGLVLIVISFFLKD